MVYVTFREDIYIPVTKHQRFSLHRKQQALNKSTSDRDAMPARAAWALEAVFARYKCRMSAESGGFGGCWESSVC